MNKETKEFKAYEVRLTNGKSSVALDIALKELRQLIKEANLQDAYLDHLEFKRKGQRRHEARNMGRKRSEYKLLKEAV